MGYKTDPGLHDVDIRVYTTCKNFNNSFSLLFLIQMERKYHFLIKFLEILTDLLVLRSSESDHIFKSWFVCVFVLSAEFKNK